MDISPEKIYQLEDKVLVDIRSPSEYQEFHIPGAINLPLFEDEEKRLIGLIYRSDGVDLDCFLARINLQSLGLLGMRVFLLLSQSRRK